MTSFYEGTSEHDEQFMGYLQSVFLLQQSSSTYLHTNSTNTVKGILSMRMYVYRTHTELWEQLCVAGRCWAVGDIMDISTDITFRGLIHIKLRTVLSECDRAAKLLFSEQMTQHTNIKTHFTTLCMLCCIIGFA